MTTPTPEVPMTPSDRRQLVLCLLCFAAMFAAPCLLATWVERMEKRDRIEGGRKAR